MGLRDDHSTTEVSEAMPTLFKNTICRSHSKTYLRDISTSTAMFAPTTPGNGDRLGCRSPFI